MSPRGSGPEKDVSKTNLKATYSRFVQLLKLQNLKDPLQIAIGGNFEAFGVIEREMLKFYGLKPDQMLIDVGCGSGRLAIPLSKEHGAGYLGTDLVEELIDYAKTHCKRPDWRFVAVDRLAIPAKDASADMVCFFSVLTHLLHEQSYLYLEEAKRVLKPGGRIVFSFLEFADPAHWPVFEMTLTDARGPNVHPMNVFIERAAIQYWSKLLEMPIVEIRDGADTFVPLPEPVPLEDGQLMSGFGKLGQAICVLEKPLA